MPHEGGQDSGVTAPSKAGRDRPSVPTAAMVSAAVVALYAAEDGLLGCSSVPTLEHIATVAYAAMEGVRLDEASA